MPPFSAPNAPVLRTKCSLSSHKRLRIFLNYRLFRASDNRIFTTFEAINKNTSISTKENSFFSLHLNIIYLFIADAQVVVNEAGNELEVRKL